MLIVFTGNGKGKTSAALGTALRSSGWKKKVCIIQFIKGNKEIGEWQFVQENKKARKQESKIEIHQFFDDEKLSISEKSILDNPEYKKSCEKAWEFAKEKISSKNFDLIILDEIINAIYLKLLNESDIFDFIRDNSRLIRENSRMDVIFTGRHASNELIDLSDLTSEINEIKHPFKKGIKAKKGIDY
ncbi:MAG TPA: cob(I)yrinic acid a,c-diamide adenosyltransferase [Patescibacteria group bacterium]|nr:cob(I)yrinic acid a,c-diamide adenosyltransferase [Patescibacteria group bacterium]